MESKVSDTCPTVVIKGQDGQPLIKNFSDYNPKIHKLFDEKEEPIVAFDRKAAMLFLDSRKVKYAKNMSDEKLQNLCEETKSTPSVVEKDGAFAMVDGEGNFIGAESFATREEAEEMLKLFTGK